MGDSNEIQHLMSEIVRRDEVIARQAAEIVVLRQTIDALVRRIFGSSCEKIDPAQLEFMLASGETDATADTDKSSADLPDIRQPGHKSAGKKRTRAPRIPEHLRVVSKTLDPSEVLLNPEAYRRIGEEVREQLDFKPAEFIRLQLVRGKYVLKDDPTAKPIISPLQPSLQDRGVATPALIAEVVDNRFVCHLPYYRQAEIFARMGVDIHRKTLCDWALLASDWLAIIYREIQYEHWRCPYRQFDETPIHYLKPGSGKAQTGYLWTSNIPGGSVFYHWRGGRDAAGAGELFGRTHVEDIQPGSELDAATTKRLITIIQCDGYSAYPSWAKDKPWIILMGCHAHVRRKFFEDTEQSPRLVAWILRQIALLYQIEAQLRETKAGPALRQAVRAAQSSMIHRRLKKLLEKLSQRRGILPKSKLGRAISYALNQWFRIEVYLSDGRVEIDNNLVENAIRPTKLGAKNCRRLGINTREYLEDVLTRLPAMLASEAWRLTPANWQKTRRGKEIRKSA
jgi:transposase